MQYLPKFWFDSLNHKISLNLTYKLHSCFFVILNQTISTHIFTVAKVFSKLSSQIVYSKHYSVSQFYITTNIIYIYIYQTLLSKATYIAFKLQFFTFDQLLLSLGIEPMILALLVPCSTIWATGKLQYHCKYVKNIQYVFQEVIGGGFFCKETNDSNEWPR